MSHWLYSWMYAPLKFNVEQHSANLSTKFCDSRCNHSWEKCLLQTNRQTDCDHDFNFNFISAKPLKRKKTPRPANWNPRTAFTRMLLLVQEFFNDSLQWIIFCIFMSIRNVEIVRLGKLSNYDLNTRAASQRIQEFRLGRTKELKWRIEFKPTFFPLVCLFRY